MVLILLDWIILSHSIFVCVYLFPNDIPIFLKLFSQWLNQ